jgi:hypothetical protein
MKFLSSLHASHFRKSITFVGRFPGFAFAVLLQVALKMKVKMKMIKMSVECWCNDAETENVAFPLCPYKSSRNWPTMETILCVKCPVTFKLNLNQCKIVLF